MRKDWKEYTIGEVAKIINGYAFKTKDFINSGVPIVKIKSLKNKNLIIDDGDFVNEEFLKLNEKYHIKYDDFVIAMTGSHITLPSSAVGRVAKSRHKDTLLLNQRVGKFKVKSVICSEEFLYHFLTTDYFFQSIGLRAKGAGNQANISGSDIESIKINLPPLPTQQKIADILSAYDDSIENNIKRIELLEEQAQLIYEEWFMRMKFPNYQNTLIDEESGLPKGWGEEKIENLVEVTSSKRIFLSDYVEEGIPFFRGKEIILKSKNQSLNDRLYITHEKFNTIRKKFGVPTTGDVLITAVGTLGYPYLVTEDDGDFYFKDGNLIWLKNDNKVLSSYLISCFKNENFKVRLNNIAIGSSQKALTIKSLKALEILLPNESLLESFNEIIQPRYELISRLQVQNQLLKEARNILLPRLMMGVIEV